MASSYVPVLLLIAFVVANAALIIGLSHLTVRLRPTPEKQTPYESGIPPLGDARERFSVKFYMVAMLFILFDVEVVFMLPWAVIYRQLYHITGSKFFGFWEMLVYLGFVGVGLFYVWKKGVLNWSNDKAGSNF